MNQHTTGDRKYCVAHPGGNKFVPRSEFAANFLTSDRLHVACRACAGLSDVGRRSSRAAQQLAQAGISSRSPIVRRAGENDADSMEVWIDA